MTPYKLYIFDLDGTLYRGSAAVSHAVEVVSRLHESGAQIAYATNNATETREFFAAKLVKMGYPARPDQVQTSGTAAGEYLVENKLKRAGVVGESGLVEILKQAGITAYAPDSDWPADLDAVVAGLDRQIDYARIAKAMAAIRDGSKFIATNRDTTFPLEGGQLVPGSGAGVAAIEACTAVAPVVMGKPEPYLIERAMKSAGIGPAETLVVGDRYDTDIVSGQRAGAAVHMVLTGVDASAPDGIPWSNDLTCLIS